jgi:acetoin utilization protein AcuB
VAEALGFMRQQKVRRLPVVDKKGRLIGIISEKDLLYASPSPATSLSVYEVGYLLSKLQVKEIMTKDVVTISPDAPLEEAARIMVDRAVGGLPVVDKDKLVGIITETDIFKTTLELLGARDPGIRLTLSVTDKPGTLSQITGVIAGLGGDITALGTFYSAPDAKGLLLIKVKGVPKETLVNALEAIQAHVTDVRDV